MMTDIRSLILATTSTEGLTGAGMAMMLLSIVLVLSLTGFCLWRILSERRPETHHHAPLDIDTQDAK